MSKSTAQLRLELKSELATRFIHNVPLKVSEFPWDYDDKLGADLAPLPGALTFYYSRDAHALNHLTKALETKNARELSEIQASLSKSRKASSQLSDSIEEIRSHDCIVDIRYQTKTIVESRALPAGAPFGAVSVSWTGGPIDQSGFAAVEHTIEETSDPVLHYFAIRRAPFLSKLEQKVLHRLPAGQTEMNLGVILAADAMQDVTKQIEQAAKDAAKTRTCGPQVWLDLEQRIESGMLSAAATVRQLVALRLELINRSIQQQQLQG